MENKNNISSIAEVQTRIFQIIWTMPEIHKRKLLSVLEKWQSKFDDEQQSNLNDKREHFRIPVSLFAICNNNYLKFKDLTKDVSAGGTFIETKTKLSLDDGIFMTFLHKNLEAPVKATGKVVRVEPKGLGIKFINPIPGMSLL
jgi:hypothetical protein